MKAKAMRTVHKAPRKTVHHDNDGLMEEMRESAQKIMTSIENITKNVDWKSAAPKIILGLVVLYGLSNRKLITTLASTLVMGVLSSHAADGIKGGFKTVMQKVA